jgi:hypothetical protein
MISEYKVKQICKFSEIELPESLLRSQWNFSGEFDHCRHAVIVGF